MRSGTTLLKSLLGEAYDASNLPETDVVRYSKYSKYRAYYELSRLSDKRIIVLKKPYLDRTPPLDRLVCDQMIIMIRNPYDTVRSLRNMTAQEDPSVRAKFEHQLTREEALALWIRQYSWWLSQKDRLDATVQIVRYEDLTSNPVSVTQELFTFIGSDSQDGVQQYSQPQSFSWEWGKDDGGPVIRSLQVQSGHDRHPHDATLRRAIDRSEEVQFILRAAGYPYGQSDNTYTQ